VPAPPCFQAIRTLDVNWCFCAGSLGCVDDDLRTEPDSWSVVGCLPAYDLRAALRAGRPKNGPASTKYRKIEILHKAYSTIFEEFNRKTINAERLRWANGQFRWSLLILAMHLGDQPEHDAILCEGPQTCKRCKCPKKSLHETGTSFPLRTAKADEDLVNDAAFGGPLPAYDVLYPKDRRRDSRSELESGKKLKLFQVETVAGIDGRSRWVPKKVCTNAVYERLRKHALGGMHIMRNSFWGLNHGADVRDILRKDPMHAFDHGVSEQMIKSTVIELQKLERALGITKNRLVTRFVKCLTLQCANNIQIAQHITLLRFKRRDVLELVENLAGLPNSTKGKHAVCDATDMQKLILTVPFLLDGLAADGDILKCLNEQKIRVNNPIPGMIECWNDYIRWYHLYRQGDINSPALKVLDTMGRELLDSLPVIFPHVSATTGKSVWCTEKVHSILHARANIKRSGRCRNASTQVTEMKHKTIKEKARNTNNQRTFGLSLLTSELRADAAAALAAHMAVSPGKRGMPPPATLLHHLPLYCTTCHFTAPPATLLHHLPLYCTILHHTAPY